MKTITRKLGLLSLLAAFVLPFYVASANGLLAASDSVVEQSAGGGETCCECCKECECCKTGQCQGCSEGKCECCQSGSCCEEGCCEGGCGGGKKS